MKLTKEQRRTIETASGDLIAAHETFRRAIGAFNAVVEPAFETLTAAAGEYDNEREEAVSAIQGVGEALRESIEEKSERWTESKAGQAAARLAARFEEFDFGDREFELGEEPEIEEPEGPNDALLALEEEDEDY